MDKEYWKNILYNSGDMFLPMWLRKFLEQDIIGSSSKTFYISYWSIIHFINGLFVGFLYLHLGYNKQHYLSTMFIIHLLWEMWQTIIGMAKPYRLTGPSNLIDTIMDTILFMLGAYIIHI